MDADRWERKRERWERKMERMGRRLERRHFTYSPHRHLFSGIVFVLFGVLFLLGNKGLLNVGYYLRFWPVILIAAGALKLIESRDGYANSSGIFWIIVGGIFLLGSLGILRVTWGAIWPAVLIGIGGLMLWRSVLSRRVPRDSSSGFVPSPPFTETSAGATSAEAEPAAGASSNSILSAMAILGGVQRRHSSQDFRGGNVTAFLGGCEIDLRDAGIISPNEPVLDVFAMWGGIEIRVPPDWTVISSVDPIMGGFEDNTRAPKETSKRIVIRGTVIMGGVEVSN